MRVSDEQAAVGLVEVRVVEMPLDVYARSTQHWDELMREFALISLDSDRGEEAHARPLPRRLNALIDELTHNFSAFTANTEADRDEALARGERTIDLAYALPAGVADGARRLGAILEEVDDYCRAGKHLITLATPPESLAFRQWYLEEFIEQIETRREPRPWSAYVAEHHADQAWASR
jgi:hypothetical protein